MVAVSTARGPQHRSRPSPNASLWPGGGHTWWAHFEFTPINITPTILRKKIEEFARRVGVGLFHAVIAGVSLRTSGQGERDTFPNAAKPIDRLIGKYKA
jgi:hypothetical protein